MNLSENNFVSWSTGPFKPSPISAAMLRLPCDRPSRCISDVDICVRYNSAFSLDYPKGTIRKTTGEVTLTFRCHERIDDLPDKFRLHPMKGG